MNYASYEVSICVPYHVALKDWPSSVPWSYPQKLAADEVRTLHASWTDGKTHWYRLTASEHCTLSRMNATMITPVNPIAAPTITVAPRKNRKPHGRRPPTKQLQKCLWPHAKHHPTPRSDITANIQRKGGRSRRARKGQLRRRRTANLRKA
ncbi:hypothetical protein F5878DRAFT_725647 [Lentinula raphanica]|uniref:Uncharacterized protein n=1 Tax=Lentinula raphanica TaxID=153919 RepID=A0AA38P8F2_9AGAR|nr:hypothetical protein F5878DRAFT_725647 [Lentinula raphanica]